PSRTGASCSVIPPPLPHCSIGCCITPMSSRVGRAAGARAFTVSGRPPERDDVDDAGGDYRSTPENAACSVRHGRATTLSLGRCRLWPDLPRPRMAGFEVSTEARESGGLTKVDLLDSCDFLFALGRLESMRDLVSESVDRGE